MKILVFDTETTGIPDKGRKSFYHSEKWPHIIQLSYILYDTEINSVIEISDNIINLADDVKISEKSIEIHGITREISKTKGSNITDVLNHFKKCVINSELIVGHNVNFDKNMIIVESIRNKLERIFVEKNKFYCTMYNSTNICKLPRPISSNFNITNNTNNINNTNTNNYKFPKLIELYKHYFSDSPEGLHNSMVDVLVTLRCFGMLYNNTDYYTSSSNLSALISLQTLYNS